jgi:hypothetical protein
MLPRVVYRKVNTDKARDKHSVLSGGILYHYGLYYSDVKEVHLHNKPWIESMISLMRHPERFNLFPVPDVSRGLYSHKMGETAFEEINGMD